MSTIRIFKEFIFPSHGRSYKFTVNVSGEVYSDSGFFISFDEVKKALDPATKILDHRCLYDVPWREAPTCENLAKWLYEGLSSSEAKLSSVSVQVTCAVEATKSKPN